MTSMPHAVSALQGSIERLQPSNWLVICNCELNENWMPDWHPDGSPKLTSDDQSVTLRIKQGGFCYAFETRLGDLANNIYAIARFLFEIERCSKASVELYEQALGAFCLGIGDSLPPMCWRRALRIRPGMMPTMAHLREALRDAKARNVPDADRHYREALIEMEDDL